VKAASISGAHRIKDWDAFRAFAKLHGDKTQSEMVQLWQGELSERTISRGAHRMDSKKKTYRERDEDKRTAFVAQLVTIAPSQRVYVDESGMDERDDYGYGCVSGQAVRGVQVWTASGTSQYDCCLP